MNIQEILKKINTLDSKAIIAWIKEVDRKVWVIVGVSAVGFILLYVFLIGPAWFQRPVLKKKVADVEFQTARLNALLPRKPELLKQKEDAKLFIESFQKRLFREDEMAFLLGRISKIANEAQVELLSSRPMEQSEAFPAPYGEKYKKFIYLVTVEGGYHQIADLVSRLESNAQYFQIQSLAIFPQVSAVGKQIADIKLMAVSHAGETSAK